VLTIDARRATIKLVLRVAIVSVLAAIVAAVSAPAALATLCDSRYGSYCCNQTLGLRLVMTYKSQWYSEKDYVAYRLRSDGTSTYRHFEAVSTGGAPAFHSYTNSVDALRQTAEQRGGSSSASWQMWEWALGSCS
jgi:hypothetical protein